MSLQPARGNKWQQAHLRSLHKVPQTTLAMPQTRSARSLRCSASSSDTTSACASKKFGKCLRRLPQVSQTTLVSALEHHSKHRRPLRLQIHSRPELQQVLLLTPKECLKAMRLLLLTSKECLKAMRLLLLTPKDCLKSDVSGAPAFPLRWLRPVP
jgi:hypothetical protein